MHTEHQGDMKAGKAGRWAWTALLLAAAGAHGAAEPFSVPDKLDTRPTQMVVQEAGDAPAGARRSDVLMALTASENADRNMALAHRRLEDATSIIGAMEPLSEHAKAAQLLLEAGAAPDFLMEALEAVTQNELRSRAIEMADAQLTTVSDKVAELNDRTNALAEAVEGLASDLQRQGVAAVGAPVQPLPSSKPVKRPKSTLPIVLTGATVDGATGRAALQQGSESVIAFAGEPFTLMGHEYHLISVSRPEGGGQYEAVWMDSQTKRRSRAMWGPMRR